MTVTSGQSQPVVVLAFYEERLLENCPSVFIQRVYTMCIVLK